MRPECARFTVSRTLDNPLEDETMAWTAPKLEEVTCGMEINMYFPAEGEDTLF